VHGLGSDRAVPDLGEAANLFGGSLDVVGVLGDALVGATLREAHVGVDLAGGHLGAERPDTEAGGHDGRCLWLCVVDGEKLSIGVERSMGCELTIAPGYRVEVVSLSVEQAARKHVRRSYSFCRRSMGTC
jgi:hypothetical protein